MQNFNYFFHENIFLRFLAIITEHINKNNNHTNGNIITNAANDFQLEGWLQLDRNTKYFSCDVKSCIIRSLNSLSYGPSSCMFVPKAPRCFLRGGNRADARRLLNYLSLRPEKD